MQRPLAIVSSDVYFEGKIGYFTNHHALRFFSKPTLTPKRERRKKTRRLKSSKEGKKIRRPLNLQIQSYEAFHVIIKVFVTLQSKLPSL